MQIKTFWVGDRPDPVWFFEVRDQNTGDPYNLTGFTSVTAVMLDTDNREVVFPADNTAIIDAASGRVNFLWPTESVFTKPGRYVMQLKFMGGSAVRRTTVQEFNIKALGGVTK